MRVLRSIAGVGALVLGLVSMPIPVRAQDLPLAQLLPDLILREIVLQSPAGMGGGSHVAHFSPIQENELDNPVVGVVEGFNTQMATQFSSFPLGSSAGGMTYMFDDSVGTFRRASSSFGPLFAERALTIGRRKLSVGFNYQHTSYKTFEGQNLDDGSIKFYLRHNDCCTALPDGRFTTQPNGTIFNPPFETDLIEVALSLSATTSATAVFANYGVTDRWDIGLAVPFVSVDVDASVRARILRLATCPDPSIPSQCNLNTHTFEAGNPNATQTVQHSGHAAGLGDIVVRSKYRFLRTAGGGLAAAVDLRVPTGDKDQLLGTGGVEGKFVLVASTERGRVGQHVNLGYTVAQGNVAGTLAGLTSVSIPDEINYSAGAELVATPRLTVIGDFVGRTLRGAGRLDLVSKAFPYVDAAAAASRPECGFPGFVCRSSIALDEFAPRAGNLNLLLGTAGAKFNPFGNVLISASVLFPLTNAGLRSRVTTVVGMDYAF